MLFLVLTAIAGAITLVSGSLTILDAIKSYPGSKHRFGWGLTIVTLLLTLIFLFASLSSQQGSASGNNPASVSSTTQPGTGETPISTQSSPTPLPRVTSTPSRPSTGTQLFPVTGANWLNGWTGGSDWYTSGNVMLNNGQQVNSITLAPYQPGNTGVSNYVVDTKIQLNKFSDAGASSGSDSFGIIVRSPDGEKGYTFAVCVSASTLASCGTNDNEIYISNGEQNIAENPYLPHPNDWHDYRMEVQGNSIKVLIDGTEYLNATDNTYSSGGEVGLWSDRSQISIRSFTITAL